MYIYLYTCTIICLTNYWFIFAVFYPYCAETDVNYSGAPVIESYNTTTTIEECVGKKFAFQKRLNIVYTYFSAFDFVLYYPWVIIFISFF